MTRTYTETVTLQEIVCGECGMTFAVPQRWLEERQQDGKGFYCPNGHGRVYRETTEKRLRKELAAERECIHALELQLTSTQDQLQASKRELQRHNMKTQHPEYATDK